MRDKLCQSIQLGGLKANHRLLCWGTAKFHLRQAFSQDLPCQSAIIDRLEMDCRSVSCLYGAGRIHAGVATLRGPATPNRAAVRTDVGAI